MTVKEGFRAKGTVLQSKQTSSQLDCAHFCFRKEGCLSFNYKLSSKTKGLCELLSDTAGHFDVSQLVNRVGWMHGQIVPFVQNRDKDAPAQCKTWRTQDGGCCVFPFIYQGSPRESCVFDGQSWCSLTENYDLDKLKGTCEDFNVTFTTLGAKGRGGPTKATGYRGTTLQDKVKLERGIQMWQVPRNGTYVIEAWGASGADSDKKAGGMGAYIKGTFNLTRGILLQILAGDRKSVV